MDVDKIKKLLDKYYSGDILPEECQVLISMLKETDDLIPELDAERRMFLAIESYEPIEPKGFEDRLILAINQRSKKRSTFVRMAFSGLAAAVVFALITIGLRIYCNLTTDGLEPTAKITTIHGEAITDEIVDTKDAVKVLQVASVSQVNLPSHFKANEDLEKSLQIADEALMNVLVSVRMAQNEMMEVIENIKITQTTDYNTL